MKSEPQRTQGPRQMPRLPRLSLMLLLGAPVAAGAADKSASARLDRIEADVVKAEERLARLVNEYGKRRGLIGGEEALKRYEDSVFSFLMGEYEPAAIGFFALVESGALNEPTLHQDSEWYLAECLFELHNWTTALAAYDRIIAEGDSHLFFADAVRRKLEIYGIVRDNEKFYETYEKWILSGRVPATDAVKYTVAKSFYRQGEIARSKAMFSELPEDSDYFGRARYFLGTELATEGEYDKAIDEFKRVAARESKETLEVAELTRLALGRINYEKGDYAAATEYYREISNNSPYFADQLYELVWTYIKQEDWDNALRHLEIFLLAYPEHAYTLQMKLIQGHLYMKQDAYERALASYENVVRDYTPLQEKLAGLERSREDPAQFFELIVATSADEFGEAGAFELPRYAVEMLVGEDAMARAVGMSQELARQRGDLESSGSVAEEVTETLAGSDESIGTFDRGRQSLGRVQDEALRQRSALVAQEIDYLADNTNDDVRPEIRALKRRWELLQGRADEVAGEESATTDRAQVHEDQVREVQKLAFAVHQVANDLVAESQATRRVFGERKVVLDEGLADRVANELAAVDAALDRSIRELERIESDASRRTTMASIPRADAEETAPQREFLVGDIEELHGLLAPYRRDATASDRGAVFAAHDELWKRVAAIESGADRIRAEIDKGEVKERELLRAQLSDHRDRVRELGGEVSAATGRNDSLAADITRSGFGALEGRLSESVMRADMGIVDVYWLRKTTVNDEIKRLAGERGTRLQDMDTRFDVIRQKLEE